MVGFYRMREGLVRPRTNYSLGTPVPIEIRRDPCDAVRKAGPTRFLSFRRR